MAVIGIMSAMHEELAAVLAAMPDKQRVPVAGDRAAAQGMLNEYVRRVERQKVGLFGNRLDECDHFADLVGSHR